MQTFQTIVVGLGAMGSATVYHLAARGHSVCGLDQFSPPHRFGSSHGETRITRLAIGEGAEYSPLVIRSHELWRQLEAKTGEKLLHQVGGLVIANRHKQASHGVQDFLQRTIDTAQQFQIPHEVLTPAELKRRYPMFQLRGDESGYYEPSAGYVCPEKCIAVQLQQARQHGATLHVHEKLISLQPSGDHIHLQTSREEYRAENVILSMGAWGPSLLPQPQQGLFQVTRQCLYWFDMEDMACYDPSRFPIFIWLPDRLIDMIYGFPAIDGPLGGIKIATEQFDETTTPDTRRFDPDLAEVHRMTELVREFLPSVKRSLRGTSCLYTSTPNFRFVITQHPEHSRVWFVSPCSGHGFKHSAAIGEALAQSILTGKLDEKISGFSFPQ